MRLSAYAVTSPPKTDPVNSYALKSQRVLLPDGLQPAIVEINGSTIAEVLSYEENLAGIEVIDLEDCILMPGLIDCHVHINEPGRADWEGFDTATKAAAAGGVTTLIDMPLNSSPVTTSVESLEIKKEAAKDQLHVNCGFWGGLVPDGIEDLEALCQSGVLGIKAFLTHSGIDEFPNVTANDLHKAMPVLSKYQLPLLVHAELSSDHPGIAAFRKNPTSYQAFLHSRPKEWENEAVRLMVGLCKEYDTPVHIVHVSSAEALPLIKAGKEAGLKLTAETCPHYLFFNAETIPDGKTLFKCAPPIREKANNELLWNALKDGTLDFIASDHSPAPPDLKKVESGNLFDAWGGISGLQFSLPAVWTMARNRGFRIEDVSRLMSTNVAAFIGLDRRKGAIRTGFHADLVAFDPDQVQMVVEADVCHRHKTTPYLNRALVGSITSTIVGGQMVRRHKQWESMNAGRKIN